MANAPTAWAASPYDDYYQDYYQPPPSTPYLSNNDAYYTVPRQAVKPRTPTDNDAYYTAPDPYQYGDQQRRSKGLNCNTIGDVPSCGSD